MECLTLSLAVGLVCFFILAILDQLQEDIVARLEDDVVSREFHNRRVLELLNANNRELEKRRKLAAAARDLRMAQRVYMAARGNEALGQKVGEAAAVLDRVLDETSQ